MNSGGLDAVQLGLISGAVTLAIKIIQTSNPGGIAPRTAGLIAAVVAALGVALWCVSQPTLPDRTWIFGLAFAWVQITAGGLGGLVGVALVTGSAQSANAALTGSAVAPSKDHSGGRGRY